MIEWEKNLEEKPRKCTDKDIQIRFVEPFPIFYSQRIIGSCFKIHSKKEKIVYFTVENKFLILIYTAK
jgi:hypothetical protein